MTLDTRLNSQGVQTFHIKYIWSIKSVGHWNANQSDTENMVMYDFKLDKKEPPGNHCDHQSALLM